MFLSKDPVAARAVLQKTPVEKLHKWLFLLQTIVDHEACALEMQCLVDDAVSIEDIQDDARASIVAIQDFLFKSTDATTTATLVTSV